LTEGVLRSMFLVKQQLRVAVLLTLGALTAGAGALGQPARAQKREEPPPAARPAAQAPEAPRRRPDGRRPVLMGRVTAVAEDGKSFTLQAAFGVEELRETGIQSAPVEVKLTPQTQITFRGVGPDGARPTVGDNAQVSLVDGSKDTAARVS